MSITNIIFVILSVILGIGAIIGTGLLCAGAVYLNSLDERDAQQ